MFILHSNDLGLFKYDITFLGDFQPPHTSSLYADPLRDITDFSDIRHMFKYVKILKCIDKLNLQRYILHRNNRQFKYNIKIAKQSLFI